MQLLDLFVYIFNYDINIQILLTGNDSYLSPNCIIDWFNGLILTKIKPNQIYSI